MVIKMDRWNKRGQNERKKDERDGVLKMDEVDGSNDRRLLGV